VHCCILLSEGVSTDTLPVHSLSLYLRNTLFLPTHIAKLGEADKVPAIVMAADIWHGCLCPRISSAEVEAWMRPEKVGSDILGPPVQADPVLHGACVDVMVHSPQEHTDIQPCRNLTTSGASENAQEA